MKRFLTTCFLIVAVSPLFLISPAESVGAKQRAGKESRQVSTVEMVRARSGSGPDEIGVITPPEANPEGPMSFALGKDREIYILDQINSRIQIFKDGRKIRSIPIPSRTFLDIDVLPNGKIVLLDNLVKKALYFLDPNGKVTHHLPLVGENVPCAPEVIGVCSIHSGDLAGVWLDLGGRSVRVASLEGKPFSNRISVPGRLTPDGKHLITADRIGDVTVVVYYSQEKFSKLTQSTITFDLYIDCLLGLWSDRNGRIYLGAMLIEKPKASNIVVVLTPEGKELGRVELFVQEMPHEIHRSIRVSPDGYIFQMALDKRGVLIKRYGLTK